MERKNDQIDPNIFDSHKKEYERTKRFEDSRIRQDLVNELSIRDDYSGREIYELIQNAEDEKSDYIRIVLNTKESTFAITNGGKECKPFSEQGYSSIMMASMSPKMVSGKDYIGNKGLGFRSLVNWAESISIISNGQECIFSKEIAMSKWEEIKKTLNNPVLVKQHEEFAKSIGCSCPVAMLSIPETPLKRNDSLTGNDATTIKIKYKKDCVESIKSQINSLSDKVLLFLRNINKIDITVDDQNYQINKPGNGSWELYTKTDKIDNKKYEITLAFNKKEKSESNPIYTYFPTRLYLHLPFILHATFDLNSSRNDINDTKVNQKIQEYIADAIVEFAEELAEKDKDSTWTYFDFINMSDDNDRRKFKIIADKLDSKKKDAKVYPTFAGYRKFEETLHYSEKMAEYISEEKNIACPYFNYHLINGYDVRGIDDDPIDEPFRDKVNTISQNNLKDIKERANFIAAASTVKPRNNENNNLAILIDKQNQLIHENAYINVGISIHNLPKDIKVNYVSEELVDELRKSFDNSPDIRTITSRLKGITDVSDLDLYAIKKKIVDYTSRMNEDGFKTLMQALFRMLCQHNECSDYSGENNNDSVREIFRNPNFKVINKANQHIFPSKVTIIEKEQTYKDEYCLLYTLDEWSKILQGSSKEVKDFFTGTVGISDSVPLDYTPIDNNSDKYLKENVISNNIDLRRYHSEELEGKNSFDVFNRFKTISDDFLNSIKNRPLSDILSLIYNDKNCMGAIRNDHILYYSYNGKKKAETKISYAAYLLRENEIFAPLKTYVISEHLCLSGDIETENSINKFLEEKNDKGTLEKYSMLTLLGAHSDLNDLSIKELYAILYAIVEKNLKKGIQSIYKAIREAIRMKPNDEEFKSESEKFKKDGKVYAREGTAIVIKPVKEVFYWDNDQLPRRILESKSKLEIGSRVGEDSVKEIFGVNLAKDIRITILNNRSKLNECLTADVTKMIRERWPFFIAYRTCNDVSAKGMKEIAYDLKNLRIVIYKTCKFSYNDENQTGSHDLGEYEMLSTKEDKNLNFHICADQEDIHTALKEPRFTEDLTEAICICMKVTSSEMALCFRSVIKNSMEENRFTVDRDIPKEKLEDVYRILGLSEPDKKFWKKVADILETEWDEQELAADYQNIIESLKTSGIKIHDNIENITDAAPEIIYQFLCDLKNHAKKEDITELIKILSKDKGYTFLLDYYNEKLKSIRDNYKESFQKYTFHEKDVTPYVFYDNCSLFSEDDWLIIDNKYYDIITQKELNELFDKKLKDKFNITIDDLMNANKYDKPEPLKQYSKILSQKGIDLSNLCQKDCCLIYFEGYDNDFIEKCDSLVQSNHNYNDDGTGSKNYVTKITFCNADYRNILNNGNTSNNKHINTGYTTEKNKNYIGRQAERFVYESMKADTEHFKNIVGHSRNLDPISGNDNDHYDISYSDRENGPTRFLEVKSMSGENIILSAGEYKFAQGHKGNYDLAIVKNQKVYFIKNPFLDPKFKAYEDSYKIFIEPKLVE